MHLFVPVLLLVVSTTWSARAAEPDADAQRRAQLAEALIDVADWDGILAGAILGSAARQGQIPAEAVQARRGELIDSLRPILHDEMVQAFRRHLTAESMRAAIVHFADPGFEDFWRRYAAVNDEMNRVADRRWTALLLAANQRLETGEAPAQDPATPPEKGSDGF